METNPPEKARNIVKLREGGFNVPDFIYVPAEDFHNKRFNKLKAFLEKHQESFKVIARSAHPQEHAFKGGTFDSLETYADLGGIIYARKRIINLAKTAKCLCILRQQMFNNAPRINLADMGLIVMPFVTGQSVMAKEVDKQWEFGYCADRRHKLQSEPYVTNTPHDRRLMELSAAIERHLGFRCEIEYIISESGEIFVVQAKDISRFDTWELELARRSMKLDGIRRIRVRRNYRERPIYVMDNKEFYIEIISMCEDIVLGCRGRPPTVDDIVERIRGYEQEMEEFAVLHERYGVLGLSIREPRDLYQLANHYLDDRPDLQKKLSKALLENQYKIDYFLAEADTLIAKDRFRLNLCTHEAYGIDTLRNPIWSIFWNVERHDEVVRRFKSLGFRTGDSIAIDIGQDNKPTLYRL